ncbi:MAG: DNA repair protein RecO [Pirellulaceae bacterium]|nr:DNA repair protein RecO [Pirellulaceae bacterium]
MEKTDAIVLRLHPWSETSLIGSSYTRDFGKISFLAKGARRPRSPFEAALDLLSFCRVVFIAKPGEALNLLTEAKLQRRFRTVDGQLLRLYCGYYLAELMEKFISEGVPQPELFELLSDSLLQLENPEHDVRGTVLRFELQLLRLIGQLPELRRCTECGDDLPEDDGILYGVAAGGTLCSACSVGKRQLMRLPQATRNFVEQFGHPAWQSIPLKTYHCPAPAAVRAMMVKTLTCLLDQKLKLHAYLEELGR